jgi:hypothetical protein
MAITTLTSNETGAQSLIDINANFVDLDTRKANLASPTFTGTPTLPTGTIATTQSVGDSTTKIATTAFVQAQIAATPAITCLTSIPVPMIPFTSLDNPKQITGNTTARLYAFNLPFAITVNKISIKTGNTVSTAGTYDLSIFSENGQTREISVTTASITTNATIYTTAVSSVVLTAGVHWFMINPNGTADANFAVYTDLAGSAFVNTTANIGMDVSSEPVLAGSLTITASTPPTTFTPTAITEALLTDSAVVFRLDN